MKRERIILIMALVGSLCTFSCAESGTESRDAGLDSHVSSDADADGDVDADSGADADTDTDAGTQDAAPCEYKWRMVFKTPGRLKAVWGSSSKDIFAVGSGPSDLCLVVHYDGESWSVMDTPEANELNAVWGSSNSDVFAVGGKDNEGSVLHYDGDTWSSIKCRDAFNMIGVWGRNAGDVFIIGSMSGPPGARHGQIFHYDGNECYMILEEQGISLIDVWGTQDNKVYAVGTLSPLSPLLYSYEGGEWMEVDSGIEDAAIFMKLWGKRSNDLFMNAVLRAPDGDSVLRYDGNEWKILVSVSQEKLTEIWGTSGSDVYFASATMSGTVISGCNIYHYDGGTTSEMMSSDEWAVTGLWANEKNKAYAAGYIIDEDAGVILHYSCD